MKHAGRLLLALAVFALLFFVRAALVEGPALLCPPLSEAQEAPEAPTLSQGTAMPMDMAASAAEEMPVIRHFFRPVESCRADAACVQVSDRNGHPLSGSTYVRTVFAACPLADMPG